MNPDLMAQNHGSESSSTPAEPPSEAGVLEGIEGLWNELCGLGHDRFQLAALETRRAGQSLVTMIVAGVLLAFSLNAAWLGLLAAGVHWLVEHDQKISTAILIAVTINLLLALTLCGLIRRHSRYLQFPAMLRSLKSQPKQPSNKEHG